MINNIKDEIQELMQKALDQKEMEKMESNKVKLNERNDEKNKKDNKKNKKKVMSGFSLFPSREHTTTVVVAGEISAEEQEMFKLLNDTQGYIDKAAGYFQKGAFKHALNWYRLAAKGGHPFGHLMIVEIIEKNFLGDTTSETNDTTYVEEWVDNLAALGAIKNCEAAFRLGLFYFRGDFGYEPNYERAYEWFSLAAENEQRSNMIFYKALCLMHAFGTQKDEKEGMRLLKKSAGMGDIDAMLELSLCYKEGNSVVVKDPEQTFKLVKEAIDRLEKTVNPEPKVLTRAKISLAQCHYEGVGTPVDKEEWLKIIAAVDVSHASPDLASLLGFAQMQMDLTPLAKKQVFEKLKKIADAGQLSCIKKVAQCYFIGIGTQKDAKKGLEYLNKAIRANDPEAFFMLGVRYFSGQGLKKDHKLAIKNFKKAEELKFSSARFYIGQWMVMYGTEDEHKKGFEILNTLPETEDNAIMLKYRKAWCYGLGRGVEKNETKAIELLQECLKEESDNVPCVNLLTSKLLFGKAGVQNRLRAFQLLKEMENSFIEQEDVPSHCDAFQLLAKCHLEGYGTGKDLRKAILYLQKSEKHNLTSKLVLAMCHFHGHGVPVNRKKGIQTVKSMVVENISLALNLWGVMAWIGWQGEKEKPNQQKAFNLFAQARLTDAAQECSDAANNLGWCYLNGFGTEKNYTLAIKHFEEARMQGNCSAINNLAWCYLNGLGVPEDHPLKAKQLFLEAKEKAILEHMPNTFGISYLGLWHLEGELERLENNFGVQGQYHLAICYLEGYGVTKNEKKALEILEHLSLKHQHPGAMLVLAQHKEDKSAFDLISSVIKSTKSMSHESKEYSENKMITWRLQAFTQLALCRMSGKGTGKNYEQGVELLERTAHLGDRQAQYAIALLFQQGIHPSSLGTVDTKKAHEWFSRAAARGHMAARCNLAESLEYGYGIPQDRKAACEEYRIAAEAGDARAQYNFAMMLEMGKILPKNDAVAFEYYYRSAKIGKDVLSWAALGKCYEFGIGTDIDLFQALDCYKQAMQLGQNDLAPKIETLQRKIDLHVQEGNNETEKDLKNQKENNMKEDNLDALDLLEREGSKFIVLEESNSSQTKREPSSETLDPVSTLHLPKSDEGLDVAEVKPKPLLISKSVSTPKKQENKEILNVANKSINSSNGALLDMTYKKARL